MTGRRRPLGCRLECFGSLVPLLWTGVPTTSTPVDRQDPLPILRCPGNALCCAWVLPDHLITSTALCVSATTYTRKAPLLLASREALGLAPHVHAHVGAEVHRQVERYVGGYGERFASLYPAPAWGTHLSSALPWLQMRSTTRLMGWTSSTPRRRWRSTFARRL